MKTANIEGKQLKLFTLEADNKLGIQFDSEKLQLAKFPYQPNGLVKETSVSQIILDIDLNKIFTKKKTYSLTPTGVRVDTVVNPVFETSQSDVDLFMGAAKKMVDVAGINGMLRDMGITRAYFNMDGSIIENQPMPISED